MEGIWEFLQGKKTYLLMGIGIVGAVLTGLNDWVTAHPNELMAGTVAYLAMLAGALKSAVSKIE